MSSGIDRTHMDTSVRPQDDLFGYVNGRWLSTAKIPGDRGRYGAFDMLREEAEEAARELIEGAADQPPAAEGSGSAQPSGADEPAPTEAAKVGALYASFMDTERINELGASPLDQDLRAIAAVTDTSGVARTSARLQRHGVDGLAHLWVTADAGSPQDYILYLHQGGIGLPDEAYYRAEEHAEVRHQYRRYLDRLLELAAPALEAAGLQLGEEVGQQVLAIEARIAEAHWDRVATRDAVKSYNRLSGQELRAQTPGWDWDAWAEGLGVPGRALEHVVARQPDVLGAIATALTELTVPQWRAYLTVRLLDSCAPYLSDDFVEAHFDFHGRTLSGTPELRARWKRGVGLVEMLLGEAVGQLYVAAHYPPEAKQRMEALVANIVEAFRRRIGELEWMGEQTQGRALGKLATFHPKIGHPVKWRDYTAMQVDATDLVGNMRRGYAMETDRELAKVGQPIDRDEWLMTPQTVNAYYHPMLNEIVFPAAILQPPFFSVDAGEAVNYGGIGAVIAHEIGHGFDDQGSRYAEDGSLSDWWTEQDRAAFDARSQALVEQFDALGPREVPGQRVNGGLTVGENIGDLCGLEMALSAYRIAREDPDEQEASRSGAVRAAHDDPQADGVDEPWTADQQFFLGWSQVWRGKARVEEARRLLSVDPHSPPDLRGNTVRNVDAFHEAFGTGEGDGLWLAPQDRVRIF
ncbi:MAG: M13 family metallopeptidase [Ornithinimicrobium sp.]|uniref:M13 family metallopeptidase n=1 Tax=Ornithinimicrobium sp. TaxID=1977084 RepID=UPI003D9B7B14